MPLSSPEAAELTKLLENIFRSVNIAMVNELAMLADRMDIDIWEVVDAAATKPFGFMRFEPGPGMGGHCLPIDPFYLAFKAREYDFPTEFIELAGKINQQQPHFCVDRIVRALNDVGRPARGSHVLCSASPTRLGSATCASRPPCGSASSCGTSERRSPTTTRTCAEVPELGLSSLPLAEALEACDVACVVTAHPEVDYEAVVAAAPLVVDFRGVTRGIEAGNLVRL